jgi:hypothetical protein
MKHFLIVLLLAWAAPLAAAQSAFLGVELDPNSELGARIVAVQQPSAASLMGLQVDDLIVGINATRLDSSASLIAGMQTFLPGEIVTVHIVRGIDELALPGILGRRPASAAVPGAIPTPAVPSLPQPDFPFQFLPDGSLDWSGENGIIPLWPDGMLKNGFPENFVPGPIWSGERPEWMGKDWGADLQFDWQPQFQLEWLLDQPLELPSDAGELGDGGELKRSVKLRYPGATPEVERAALIEAAIEQYGAEVEVSFEGEGRSVSIQTTRRSSSALPGIPTPPTPPVPPKADPDDEI